MSKMNKPIFIEYDGRQHFEPLKIYDGEKSFEELKENDKLKDDFCKKNNYPLLRINYKQHKQMDKLILDFINVHIDS